MSADLSGSAGAPARVTILGVDRRLAVVAICVAAFVLRMAAAWLLPNVVHPDELQQYGEQAFRVVYGHGLLPWEYQVGARSWLIPGMLIPWMALCKSIGASPETIRLGVAAIASLLSVVIVASAYALGERAIRFGGIWAAAIVCCWPETVYYSPHILADTVSAVPMMAALAITWRQGSSSRRLLLGGSLFALAVLLRPQLAPAIGIAGLWIAGRDLRRYLYLALGAVPALVLFGLVDWITWGVPFQSLFRYVHVNGAGVAATFGTAPWYSYFLWQGANWSVAAVLVIAALVLGSRRAPLPAVMAAILFATFSAVGHKEGRFIYPAVPLILTVCGVGTAVAVRWLSRADSWGWRSARTLTLAAAGLWLLGIGISVTRPALRGRLADGIAAQKGLRMVNADPASCGVAVSPADRWGTVGHARVRQGIGLYAFRGGDQRVPHGYNRLLVFDYALPRPHAPIPGFRETACFRGGGVLCVYARDEPCVPGIDPPMTAPPGPAVLRVLRREGLM